MKKCLIVFFSLYESTEKVAQSISAGLRTAGYQVDLYNIKDKNVVPPDPKAYDLLGIGNFNLFGLPPFRAADYLKSLPDLNGLPTFVFVTYGGEISQTGNFIRETLADKNGKEIGYFICHGESKFLPYLRLGLLFFADHPTQEELGQAEAFGCEVAARVAGKPYTKPAYDPKSSKLARFFGNLFFNRWIANNIYTRLFRLDKKKCPGIDKCKNPCTKLCPNENITADKNGFPVWGRDCLHCMTCGLKCPEDAIDPPLCRLISLFNCCQILTRIFEHEHHLKGKPPVKIALSKGEIKRIS